MTEYAELEVRLSRRNLSHFTYQVEMRFVQPQDEVDNWLLEGDTAAIQLLPERLAQLELDSAQYGQYLGEQLLGTDSPSSTAVRGALDQALANVAGKTLRMRLFIDSSAPELHGVRWETLRDPVDGGLLFTNANLLFSRYLSSQDWSPVRLRALGDLSALVAIANPDGLEEIGLEPVKVAAEKTRAEEGLAKIKRIQITVLAGGGQASLSGIDASLRGHEGYDILYLVCHGALRDGRPYLWLDGVPPGEPAPGAELVALLGGLKPEQRPRLVVLASCQSAAGGAEPESADAQGALAALGPRLAAAGIPAVLAMQGNITMATVEKFMPTFFETLAAEGQLDHAVTVARNSVYQQKRKDYWMPALFTRLRSGRLWYTPHFADGKDFEKWDALINDIRRGRCTPILGAGLNEPLLGSLREAAQYWAKETGFPMAAHTQESLPQVAQYIAIRKGEPFLHEQLMEYFCRAIIKRHENALPEQSIGELRATLEDEVLRPEDLCAARDKLIRLGGAYLRDRDEAEPHRVLALLPFDRYISANTNSLLEQALKAGEREPLREICRWNTDAKQIISSAFDDNASPAIDRKHPLVYYIFGHDDVRDSLVTTEDDYFRYLIGATKNPHPHLVLEALTNSALIFLGFQIDDWDFRVLFHSIMSLEGSFQGREYTRVAVQIDPEEGRLLSPKRARDYLTEYFNNDKISIYWGSAQDFARELHRQWKSAPKSGQRRRGGSP